ncbi:MAG: RES family NAD+ phosphorylase [Desulfuromonadaceae bacterium]|nr:RES family NAD+ phosphorylase [Desulfuromonadaceae bacterium]
MGIETLRRKNVCCDCVGETFLNGEIRREGKTRTCSYCGKRGRCVYLERMSARVQEAFEEYYQPTPDPIYADRFRREWGNEPGLPTDETIQLAAGVTGQVASDIQEILSEQYSDSESWECDDENPFSSDNRYILKIPDDTIWSDDWSYFTQTLATETRFFSPYAVEHLDRLFEGIEVEQTSNGTPIVVTAGPGTDIPDVFRARFFQSNEELKTALQRPDLHLGPPPSERASAGRMNADGISVFYGANDSTTALAEVRPPVGSRVAIARFEIILPLRLLDLSALSSIDCRSSVFERGNSRRLERAAFLRNLARLLAKPVLPYRERFEYLPTQAIADYLATRAAGPLDGIIFPSVQAGVGALNLVFFHKASRMHKIELPQGTDISVSGWEGDYAVYEVVPGKEEGKAPSVNAELPLWAHSVQVDHDYRRPTLQIDIESICVQYVTSVNFETDKHIVRRSRREKGMWDL